MLHVNANATRTDERGMLLVWNQTPDPETTTLKVPLYYTGLTESVSVSVEGAKPGKHTLARDFSIELSISLAPMSFTWVLIR
jgi:hypothetical protein